MTYVVSLEDFAPSPRYDGVPFIETTIREAAAALLPDSTGWAVLETQPPDPVDPDPSEPLPRRVTTSLAQLPAGWYDLVFRDAAGHEEITEAVSRSGTLISLPPSEDVVRARSPLLQGLYPAAPYDPAVERTLRELVLDAVDLIQALTGRMLDSSLPRELARIALRAITMKTEQIAVQSQPSRRRGSIGNQSLRSISAGPWSESYFGPGEAAQSKALDLDPTLHQLLWALATEEKRQEWLLLWGLATFAPAAAVQSFDFRPRGVRRY